MTVVATNPDGSASAASNPTVPVGGAGVNRAALPDVQEGQEVRGQGQDVKKKKAAKAKADRSAKAKAQGRLEEGQAAKKKKARAPVGTMQGWPTPCAASSSSRRPS